MKSNGIPRSERLHIAFFGRCNSGKSSLINALTGQQTAIVSDRPGTTTDPVHKNMELPGLGACVLIDTPGFDDADGALGAQRVERALGMAGSTDIAVVLIPGPECAAEAAWIRQLETRGIPVVAVCSKADRTECPKTDFAPHTRHSYTSEDTSGDHCQTQTSKTGPGIRTRTASADSVPLAPPHHSNTAHAGSSETLADRIERQTGLRPVSVSALRSEGLDELCEALVRAQPETEAFREITAELAAAGDVVLLVMPQDASAPKGRLILPQVQTLRELLDKGCTPVCCTADGMEAALAALAAPPDLIITDSQVFARAAALKPAASRLTSFSILFARYKGDIGIFVAGAEAIGRLTEASCVLIAEACTHAPQSEDIGRVKIPAMLRKRIGPGLKIDHVSGADFPADLRPYDLVIHCGACMFNRRHVMSRVEQARTQGVPITNYGVAIAYLQGILGQVEY